MLHLDFLELLSENIPLYLICLLFNIVIFWKIGKKVTHTWIDPLRLSLVFATFANAIPPFLYFTNTIDSDIFFHFLLSESVLWGTFLFFARSKIRFSSITIVNENKVAFCMYIFFFLLYVILIGFTYAYLGIPLFMPSRLALFVDTSLGSIERLLPFLQLFCLLFSFYLLDITKKRSVIRFIVYFVFTVFVVTGILSGSKSGLTPFLTAAFGYYCIYKKETFLGTKYIKYISFAVLAGILVVVLSTDVSFISATQEFFFRFIASGDVYWMGYPDHLYAKTSVDNSFSYLFSGILAPLRIIDVPVAGSGLGFQLSRLVNPGMDLLVGPNIRPSMLGLMLFGWGGVFLTFGIGLFLAFVIFQLPKLLPKGILSVIYYTYLYSIVIIFIQDPAYGIGCISNIVFCTLFFIGSLFICMSIINKLIAFKRVK